MQVVLSFTIPPGGTSINPSHNTLILIRPPSPPHLKRTLSLPNPSTKNLEIVHHKPQLTSRPLTLRKTLRPIQPLSLDILHRKNKYKGPFQLTHREESPVPLLIIYKKPTHQKNRLHKPTPARNRKLYSAPFPTTDK